MIKKKLLKELKAISPTFKEYYDAKCIIEKYEKQLKYNEKFYVQMDFEYYAVGTFGGWDGNYFMLKIEDIEPYSHIKDTHYVCTPIEYVYTERQKGMKILHAGIE